VDILDAVLLALCALFGISGYRQGFIVGVLSFAGLVGGALLGATYAPSLHRALGFHGDDTLFGLVTFVVLAGVGQVIGTFVGALIRNRLTWRPARVIDSAGGAVVGVISVLLVSWLVGNAATTTSFQTVNRQVSNSTILGLVDHLMPSGLRTVAPAFRRLLNASGFPQVFSSLGPQTIVPVSPPDPALARSAVVRRTEPSVMKITGVAESCSRSLEGSGFVISPQHVLTHAHVVAGVSNPVVRTATGASYAAHVVLFDANRDVAVLYAPGLDVRPLPLASSKPASRGDSAIVLGYPENGPFTARSARIREVQQAQGPNIYQDRQVSRQIYSLYAIVQPGNSGGPLINPGGQVDGVVFAASTDSKATGYALTAAEVKSDVQRGRQATATVSSDGCD
jgi:S1-C subfamily serine protease